MILEALWGRAAGSASLRSPSPAALFDLSSSESTSWASALSKDETVLACRWRYRCPTGLNQVSTKPGPLTSTPRGKVRQRSGLSLLIEIRMFEPTQLSPRSSILARRARQSSYFSSTTATAAASAQA